MDRTLRSIEELSCEEILIEVEHVNAHRAKRETRHMPLFAKFITVATEGAMLDG